ERKRGAQEATRQGRKFAPKVHMIEPSDDPDMWMDSLVREGEHAEKMCAVYRERQLISITVHVDGGGEETFDNLRITGVVRRKSYVLFRLRPQLVEYDFANIRTSIRPLN